MEILKRHITRRSGPRSLHHVGGGGEQTPHNWGQAPKSGLRTREGTSDSQQQDSWMCPFPVLSAKQTCFIESFQLVFKRQARFQLQHS